MKHSDLHGHLPKTHGNLCLQNKSYENSYRKLIHNVQKSQKISLMKEIKPVRSQKMNQVKGTRHIDCIVCLWCTIIKLTECCKQKKKWF